MGKFLAVLLALGAGVGLFLLISYSMLTGNGLDINLSKAFLWIGIQVIGTITAFLTFMFFTKMLKNPVLGFLDKRWLPPTKSWEEYQQLPPEKKRAEAINWQTLGLGETHQATKNPAWWATTFLRIVKPVSTSLLLGFVVGTSLSLVVSHPVIGITIGFFLTLLLLLFVWPAYFTAEWKRQNTLYLLFSDKLVVAEAFDGGLIGLITGKVGDVRSPVTPLSQISEPEKSNDPRRFRKTSTGERYDPHDLLNSLFDLLGSTKHTGPLGKLSQGLMAIHYPSRAINASDVLLPITWGQSFDNILQKLRGESLAKLRLIEEVERAANIAWVDAKSGPDDWDKDASDNTASDMRLTRLAHLTPPSEVNVWSLRKDPGIWNLETGELIHPPIGRTARSVRGTFTGG